jgi:hypothetical protein
VEAFASAQLDADTTNYITQAPRAPPSPATPRRLRPPACARALIGLSAVRGGGGAPPAGAPAPNLACGRGGTPPPPPPWPLPLEPLPLFCAPPDARSRHDHVVT